MAKKSNNKKTPMEKLTAGYEKFIKGKELNPDGKSLFEETVKKAIKKQHGTK